MRRHHVEEYLKQYGMAFRDKRLRLEMTQLQVARSLNISQAIISHIETGRMLPPKEIEEALHDLFNGVNCENRV